MGFDLYISLFDLAQYRERVEPALQNYFASGEANDILRLLEEVRQRSGEASDLIQSSISILNGSEFYGPSFNHIPPAPGARTNRQDLDYYVRFTVVGQLVEGLCTVKIDGRSAEQNMGRSALVPYLYEHSSWIENLFTGEIYNAGTSLNFPPAEYAEIIASDTVKTLLSELNAIPQPDSKLMPAVAKQFSNLKQILEMASRDSGRVALVTGG